MREPEPAPRTVQGRLALVLCTAEHGFVGGFNERLFEAAQAVLRPTDALFVLGTHAAAPAVEHGRPPRWQEPMATGGRVLPATRHLLAHHVHPPPTTRRNETNIER